MTAPLPAVRLAPIRNPAAWILVATLALGGILARDAVAQDERPGIAGPSTDHEEQVAADSAVLAEQVELDDPAGPGEQAELDLAADLEAQAEADGAAETEELVEFGDAPEPEEQIELDGAAELEQQVERGDAAAIQGEVADDDATAAAEEAAAKKVAGFAQDSTPPGQDALEKSDGPAYAVTYFSIQYAEDETELRALQGSDLTVDLGVAEGTFVEPKPGLPTRSIALPVGTSAPSNATRESADLYRASAIGYICSQLVARLQARGWVGIYVAPHPGDIDLETEADLRRAGDDVMRLVVSTGRVRALRSLGFGDRLPDSWRINNKVHRRIRERSPLQPAENGREDTTDRLNRDLLEDYLFRLNRHPGRRVDAALAPAEDGLGADLDYRISESKPWFVYAQTSNTGTDETNPWQNRAGYVNRQLTNNDDILSLDYLNSGGKTVNAVNLGYGAPFFSSQRPAWLDEPDDPDAWFPVDKIPWIGSDFMRWEVGGSWSRTETNGVDGTDDIVTNEWDLGGGFRYNVFQHRALFVDLYAGLQMRSLEVDNGTLASNTREYLWQPEIGIDLERHNEYSDIFGSVSVEYSARPLSDKDGDESQFFGRTDPDNKWWLLHFDTGVSYFLEPLFNRANWEDPSTTSSSKLAHEVALSARGQTSFGARLIPQFSQVVGGLYSVRGYPQSQAAGDTVAVGTFEYRYHLARSLPISRRSVRVPYFGQFRLAPQQVYGQADWDLVLRGFVDAGRTIRYDKPSGSLERNQTLVGVGLGAELQIWGNVRAGFDWGHALRSTRGGSDPVDAGNDEFYFSFSVLY